MPNRLDKSWLAQHSGEIEVFYLPSNSPQLNPNEMLNADLKGSMTKQVPARTKEYLKKVTISHLRRLQKPPQRVARFSCINRSAIPLDSSS